MSNFSLLRFYVLNHYFNLILSTESISGPQYIQIPQVVCGFLHYYLFLTKPSFLLLQMIAGQCSPWSVYLPIPQAVTSPFSCVGSSCFLAVVCSSFLVNFHVDGICLWVSTKRELLEVVFFETVHFWRCIFLNADIWMIAWLGIKF